ncbi:MAG TPA: endonuclease/exonuclease/phosphatase family protein [Herpetosiphonaceae bacterium]
MRFSLMTYNILDGAAGREELVAEVLAACRPDLVLLQEVIDPAAAAGWARAGGYHHVVARSFSKRRIALLSRFPIERASCLHPFPPIRTTILKATVLLPGGRRLALFGAHLVPHFAWWFELWRRWEVAVLLREAARGDNLPAAIAGDFNAIAPGDGIGAETLPANLRRMLRWQGDRIFHLALGALLRAGWADCFRTLHPGERGWTLPPDRPNARLDYVFANQALLPALRSCAVVREPAAVLRASDHLPVLAEFEL